MLDSLAAKLRCIPVPDHAAKVFFKLISYFCCCRAGGYVGKPLGLSISSGRDHRAQHPQLLRHRRLDHHALDLLPPHRGVERGEDGADINPA